MNIVSLNKLSQAEYNQLCARPMLDYKTLHANVQLMLDAVKQWGDVAVREYTEKFDGVVVDALQVTKAEFTEARSVITPDTVAAVEMAMANITAFHKPQMREVLTVETQPGVVCSREARPIEKVGIYIPGGTAPLCSTVLMMAVPAKLAGCRDIIICTPPDNTGKIDPNILYAAEQAGVTAVYKVGGAQAIAAMAYGTSTIPKVYKVFGPGNQYVTAAKLLVSIDPQGAANDLPAGPSEVLVLADDTARPDFVAADALSQAEHGTDSQAMVVCLSQAKAKDIDQAIEQQLALLPRRDIAAQALNNSAIMIADSITQALQFANDYAPEHLILNVAQAASYKDQIINAGSVFLGPWSPESAGDYASGTNHTLPTNGAARAFGGVSMDSFVKYLTFQELTEQGAKDIAPAVETLAALEGLDAHQRAMQIRHTTIN